MHGDLHVPTPVPACADDLHVSMHVHTDDMHVPVRVHTGDRTCCVRVRAV